MSGRVKFKDFSRTFKAMYQQIQGLNTEEEGVRNQQNLTLNCSKRNFIKFKKSFLPSTIKFWNTLPEQLRNSSSVDSFRNNLTRDLFYVPPANKLFNLGDRYLNILHTRLRLKNCALNYYLYLMNCIESPSCICGAFKEDVTHYLMFCPYFAALRDSMLSSIVQNAGNNWLSLSLSQQVDSLLNLMVYQC